MTEIFHDSRFHTLLIFILINQYEYTYTQQDTIDMGSHDLRKETMLHPADAFTGYVLKKGEWIYNQALTPYPSWLWVGITNRITAELDVECLLGGIPSFNFRIGLTKQKKRIPSISFETMYQYLDNERDQFHNLTYLDIIRYGSNWYNHINASWQIKDYWYIHLSGGFTYADFISFSNNDSLNRIGSTFNSYLSPDLCVGLDYRFKKWITLHTTISYGSTFLYADNIIRKEQLIIATRIAPFINSKKGFFNSFRLELAFMHVYFQDAKESITGPSGFLYWQWK